MRNTFAALFAAVLIAPVAATGAYAQSGSAKAIIQAQIREACEPGSGTMKKGGAIIRTSPETARPTCWSTMPI